MDRFVVISGCSAGGKSTLLAELSRRGHAVVEEPGRRIVQEELQGEGLALPWVDPIAFARRAITMSLEDLFMLTGGTDDEKRAGILHPLQFPLVGSALKSVLLASQSRCS